MGTNRRTKGPAKSKKLALGLGSWHLRQVLERACPLALFRQGNCFSRAILFVLLATFALFLLSPGSARASEYPGAPANGSSIGSVTELSSIPVAAFESNESNRATNLFDLRFRNAPVRQVLEYLSRVAGFIIVSEIPKQTIDLWIEHPVQKDEAIELLNTALQQSGSSAVLAGRKLSIVTTEQARLHHSPVIRGSDPEQIPETEKLVTQVIPVRFVEVVKLLKDLQPLVSMNATLTANESANSVVVTDQQGNIRRLVQIINAIDSSAEETMLVKIFSLHNSNPTEAADLLSELFPDQSSSADAQAPPFAGGGGPGGFGGPPFGGGPENASDTGGSNTQDQRLQKRARVIAQADERTASLVVVAAQSLMPQIERIIMQLDSNPKGRQTVSVYPLHNAGPSAVKQALKDLFQKNTSTANNRSDSNQTDPLATRLTSQTQQNSSGRTSLNSNGGNNAGGGGFSPQQ